MSDKAFRQLTPTFHPAKTIHLFVKRVERSFRALAGMSVPPQLEMEKAFLR